MLRAVWNGVVLAETPRTIRLEGNHYFPPDSLNPEYFTASRTRSVCPWKGLASYYTVVVDGQANPDAAWYYPHPSPLARRIKNHVAFWNGVRIEGDQESAMGRNVAAGRKPRRPLLRAEPAAEVLGDEDVVGREVVDG